MKKLMKYTLGAAMALTIPAMPAMAQDIDTTVGGTSGNVNEFGAVNTATYGQTFNAGGTSINSFSLFLDDRFSGAGTVDFRGYLGSWDGTKVGSILFSSATMSHGDGGLAEYTFNTGGLGLTAGATYVAFLSISDLPAQAQSTFGMPIANDNIDGNFVFLNNGTDFSQLTTNNWSTFIGDQDVFFTAGFGAVPEPATWGMLIFGFGAIGGAMRRRRQTVRVSYA